MSWSTASVDGGKREQYAEPLRQRTCCQTRRTRFTPQVPKQATLGLVLMH